MQAGVHFGTLCQLSPLRTEQVSGRPMLTVKPHRAALARYGITLANLPVPIPAQAANREFSRHPLAPASALAALPYVPLSAVAEIELACSGPWRPSSSAASCPRPC